MYKLQTFRDEVFDDAKGDLNRATLPGLCKTKCILGYAWRSLPFAKWQINVLNVENRWKAAIFGVADHLRIWPPSSVNLRLESFQGKRHCFGSGIWRVSISNSMNRRVWNYEKKSTKTHGKLWRKRSNWLLCHRHRCVCPCRDLPKRSLVKISPKWWRSLLNGQRFDLLNGPHLVNGRPVILDQCWLGQYCKPVPAQRVCIFPKFGIQTDVWVEKFESNRSNQIVQTWSS